MHPIRGGQEEAPVDRDRGRVADEVLQRRFLGAFRMDTLGHLGELVRVAKEHDRLRAAAHRDDVRQRHLTGLIDEQDVQAIFHLCASKQPGRAAGHVVAAAGQAALDLPVVRRHADAVGTSGILPAVALLHDAHGLAGPFGGGRDCIDKVADGPVRLSRDTNPASDADQFDDHPGSGPRLARAGRPLDGKRRLLQGKRESPCRVERCFARLRQRAARWLTGDSRRPPQDQVAHGPVATWPLDPVLESPIGDPPQGVAHDTAAVGLARNQGARVLAGTAVAAQQVDRAGRLVDRHDLACLLTGCLIDRAVARLDLEILGGIEAVAMDAAPLDPPEFADVRQIAQRLCRVDELLHGCVAQAEPQPPRRFLVSPVPVEQLGQEPSRRLILRSEGLIGRYLLRQRVNPGLRLSLPRRELFRRGPILRLRPRQVPALLGDCGRPQSFEP